jgi:hypothetical protein
MSRKPITTPHRKARSLLLYIAGDNDLSDAGLRDISELCEEGSAPNVHVGVEIDTRGEYSGSIRYEITEPDFEGKAHRTVIERLQESDSGKPRTLMSFINWGMKRFPAEETALVIGGHGDGFRRRRRSIALDEGGSALDMPEIEYVFKRCKIGDKNKLGILGFDACLMGMLDIAYHFSNYTRILVGSQEVEPGDGWPYEKVLQHLKHSQSIECAAKGIINSYIRHYVAEAVTNVTQSAIDLSKTRSAMQALSALGHGLSNYLKNSDNNPEYLQRLQSLRHTTQSFSVAEYVDAIHFAEQLSLLEEPVIKNLAEYLITKLNACIIFNRNLGREVQHANGLSIWFPAATFSYAVNRSRYINLNGTKEFDGWINFLDTFFGMLRLA